MNLKIRKIYEDSVIPTRAHHDDAGIDLYTYGIHTIAPHSQALIPTGIACEIEEGNVGLIWDKSSIGAKGITTLGGVIDAGYRGEVQVIAHNLTDESFTFSHGQKVAQLLIQKVELCGVEVVDELNNGDRGVDGFGSTGK